MSITEKCLEGNYRFILGVSQYSAGVAAEHGYRIERVRFSRLLPLDAGFSKAVAFLHSINRPLTSFCACELRLPEPLNETGFRFFNQKYIGYLSELGIIKDGRNPVARSNVCPILNPPIEPSMYAFSYTTSGPPDNHSFIISGSAEVPEGSDYIDHIIRRDDVSQEGLAEKARWVLGEIERRLMVFGVAWSDTTATQLYTVHNPHSIVVNDIMPRGAMMSGLTWHLCRPPVSQLEYEMDCRSVLIEKVMAI